MISAAQSESSREATDPERRARPQNRIRAAVALHLRGDHRRVVDEPVDQGGTYNRIAEDGASLLEAAIRVDTIEPPFV